MVRYVPDAGHIVWLAFDPQAGHEQAGRRPALVLSPAAYNAKSGLMLCCPITSKLKSYPFEVAIASDGISGAVLSDQVKSLDWQARRASLAGQADADTMSEVRARIRALLGFR